MPSALELQTAVRSFFRRPETLVTALVLGCGLGAAGIVFVLVDHLLLRPLPYPAADRLAMVWQSHRVRTAERQPLDPETFRQLRERARSFAALGAFVSGTDVGFDLPLGGSPERIAGAAVTPEFFGVLGVPPFLGRTFQGGPGDERTVVLSHSLWRQRFGSDPAVVGRPLRLSGQVWTIAGVMPPGFDFPGVELWVPDPAQVSKAMNLSLPVSYGFRVIGRLGSSVSLPQVRQEVAAVGQKLLETSGGPEGSILRVVSLREHLTGSARPVLMILLAGVGALLAATCANAANLLLVQLDARRRELAVRSALGASRARLARQLLTEGLLLGLVGGGLGLLVCHFGLQGCERLSIAELSAAGAARMDERAVAFMLVAAAASGLLLAALPALRGSRTDPAAAARGLVAGTASGGSKVGPRGTLVLAEVALAFVLLTGASLLARSVISLARHDLGFDARGVLTGKLVLSGGKYAKARAQAELLAAVVHRARDLPGVLQAAVTNSLPFEEGGLNLPLLAEGRPEKGADLPAADCVMVSADYFQALGIRRIQGRGFSNQDREGSLPVVILDETIARQLFGERSPLGKRVQVFGTWREVVGLVPPLQQGGFRHEARPMAYLPHSQFSLPWPFYYLVVRTRGNPENLGAALRSALSEVSPDQTLSSLSTLEERAARSIARERAAMAVISLFGLFALALALGGVYAVVSFSVQQRGPEMAIRAALGARRTDLLASILFQGARIALLGIVLGVVISLGADRLLSSLLYGVAPNDPLSLGVAAGLLALLAMTAALVPALRVLRVDPARVLKEG